MTSAFTLEHASMPPQMLRHSDALISLLSQLRVTRPPMQLLPIFATIFEHKLNRCHKISLRFIGSVTLTICFRRFGTLCNKPVPIALDNRSELVSYPNT